MIRPGDQIDALNATQGLHSRLGVTAGHGDEGVRVSPQQAPDKVPALGLGLTRHETGVDNAEIRRGRLRDRLEAAALAATDYPLKSQENKRHGMETKRLLTILTALSFASGGKTSPT